MPLTTTEVEVKSSETTRDLIQSWARKNRERPFAVRGLPDGTKICILVLAVNSAATAEDRNVLVDKAKLVPGVIDAVLPLSGDVPTMPATLPEGCTIYLKGSASFAIDEPPEPKQPE